MSNPSFLDIIPQQLSVAEQTQRLSQVAQRLLKDYNKQQLKQIPVSYETIVRWAKATKPSFIPLQTNIAAIISFLGVSKETWEQFYTTGVISVDQLFSKTNTQTKLPDKTSIEDTFIDLAFDEKIKLLTHLTALLGEEKPASREANDREVNLTDTQFKRLTNWLDTSLRFTALNASNIVSKGASVRVIDSLVKGKNTALFKSDLETLLPWLTQVSQWANNFPLPIVTARYNRVEDILIALSMGSNQQESLDIDLGSDCF